MGTILFTVGFGFAMVGRKKRFADRWWEASDDSAAE